MQAFWVRVGRGDSVRVVDRAQARITTFTPSLQMARMQRTGGYFYEIEFLNDAAGRYVITGMVSARSSIGLPVHLVSADGSVLRSFGSVEPIEDVRNTDLMWRNITPVDSTGVWSAPLTEYVLEHWNVDGRRLQRLVREVDWFRPHGSYGYPIDPHAPPTPGLMDVDYDDAGQVWAAIHVADPSWKDALGERPDPYGRPTIRILDEVEYYDTLVEIISPAEQKVVGRVRLDAPLLNLIGDGLVATRAFEGPGYPVIRIWEIQPPPQSLQERRFR